MIKTALGLMAVLLALTGYIPYFRDILAKKTRPHAFTWFIWFLLTAIAFFAQINAQGRAGAWVTGVTAIISFAVFIAALRVGHHTIVRSDWLFLSGALLALAAWAITKNPLLSVLLVTLIDLMAFIPTFRKSFHKPYEETLSTYRISSLKFAVGLLALDHYSLTTMLYPLFLVVTNALFVIMVTKQRKRIELL